MAKVRATTDDMLHVVKWHNGDKRWSPFSDQEMSRRQNDLPSHLTAAKVDACVVHVISQHLLLFELPILLLRQKIWTGHRP